MNRLIIILNLINLSYGSREVLLCAYEGLNEIDDDQAPIVADVKSDVDNIFRFAQDHMTEVENEEERNEDEGEEDEL